jgi:hypothetical protein
MKRWASLAALIGAMAVGVTSASAGAPSGSRVFVQDFEQSTAGWVDNPPGTIHRVPSGYDSPSDYGDFIVSAHGKWHARLRTSDCELLRFTGPVCTGPFTRWGKPTSANPVFPSGGYMTEVDIYLDVPWVATGGGKMDYRYDWSSAINDNMGNHRRDFIFNVGTPLTAAEAQTAPGYYVNASTNGNRSGAFPQNPCPNPSTAPNYCRTPVKITQSGWYTFRHRFYPRHHMGIDYLAVDFTVLRHDGVVMANWFISVTDAQDLANSDRMSRVGGDRYGWFVINEINDLAIDCSNLRPPSFGHPPLRGRCEFKGDDRDEGRHDDDDHDHDGHRNGHDDDDDNDGHYDSYDADDDNDGLADDMDQDDDNDGIQDSFDSESQREAQQANFSAIAGGQETSYSVEADADTLLLVATAEPVGALDVLNQALTVEIYNPAGVLVAAAPPVLGTVVATAVPAVAGTYTVKVRNSSSDTIQYQTSRITRTSWPLG